MKNIEVKKIINPILTTDGAGTVHANNYTNTTYSAMTNSTLGLGKLRYTRGSTPAAESQTTTANRTYGVTDNFQSLYTFYRMGFNVRATDLQAFIGINQLEKAL